MLIRIFIILVMMASGYLMLARSPDWRPWWSQQMARLGFGSETAHDNQLEQMHQELAAIKQQFAELKVALQSEVQAQIGMEEQVQHDVQTDQAAQNSEVAPLQEMDALASTQTVHTTEPAAIPRDELMKMAERMELRAIQYGE